MSLNVRCAPFAKLNMSAYSLQETKVLRTLHKHIEGGVLNH